MNSKTMNNIHIEERSENDGFSFAIDFPMIIPSLKSTQNNQH